MAFGFLAQTPIAYAYLGAVIPVVVVLGLFTYERLIQTSLEDVAALDGIHRNRRYYRTLLPGAEDFFPAPSGSQALNELLEIGPRGTWKGVLFTISFAIAVVNSIVAGAGIAVVFYALTNSFALAISTGIACAIAFATIQAVYQSRRYAAVTSIIVASHLETPEGTVDGT